MIDFTRVTLLLYIIMRMSGFVLFNPILGRKNMPGIVRTGFILVLTLTVFSIQENGVAVPVTLVELVVRLTLELMLGFVLGFVMQFFFAIPQNAGFIIDMQMGMSMASTYDAGSQINATVSANILNLLMMLIFFAGNGHHTLLRIMLNSGEVVPFGAAVLGPDVVSAMAELFVNCILLAVKLSLPVLAAELLGEVGMGILMKAIPQINVFVINIELKVIVGLLLVFVLLSPFNEFLLAAEREMLDQVGRILTLLG